MIAKDREKPVAGGQKLIRGFRPPPAPVFGLASRFWVFGSIACFFEIRPAQHIFEKPSSRKAQIRGLL